MLDMEFIVTIIPWLSPPKAAYLKDNVIVIKLSILGIEILAKPIKFNTLNYLFLNQFDCL